MCVCLWRIGFRIILSFHYNNNNYTYVYMIYMTDWNYNSEVVSFLLWACYIIYYMLIWVHYYEYMPALLINNADWMTFWCCWFCWIARIGFESALIIIISFAMTSIWIYFLSKIENAFHSDSVQQLPVSYCKMDCMS